MRYNDSFRFVFSSLKNRKLRSWLTIFGIVIGSAAVVALLSIVNGFQEKIQEQLSSLGGNAIFISPGFSRASRGIPFGNFGGGGFQNERSSEGNLTSTDLQAIKSVPEISAATGIVSERKSVKYVSENFSASVQGVDPNVWEQFSNTPLQEGRYLRPGDNHAAVLGYRIANSTFKEKVQLNRVITINGESFRVVGILQQGGAAAQTDGLVIIPIENARKTFTGTPENQFSQIVAKASDDSDPSLISSQITQKLLTTHHVIADKQDFTVLTSASLLQTVNDVMATASLLWGGIAGISLLVGGIGIANTMFMSVFERTKQIGILKALGATNSEVMKLFMIESASLGLIGGILGSILGIGIAMGISQIGFVSPAQSRGLVDFGRAGTLTASVSPELIIFILGFSVLIGIVSGILPARRAAALQPVEALRYE
ncbi:MAG TPA: ABC transporter permease [archaeon]|nr:ABC transporter permease [archaeon]